MGREGKHENKSFRKANDISVVDTARYCKRNEEDVAIVWDGISNTVLDWIECCNFRIIRCISFIEVELYFEISLCCSPALG